MYPFLAFHVSYLVLRHVAFISRRLLGFSPSVDTWGSLSCVSMLPCLVVDLPFATCQSLPYDFSPMNTGNYPYCSTTLRTLFCTTWPSFPECLPGWPETYFFCFIQPKFVHTTDILYHAYTTTTNNTTTNHMAYTTVKLFHT